MMLPHFRIFIDAATLKDGIEGSSPPACINHFRIFIDAATLKAAHQKACLEKWLNFRIFIDAATLKGGLQNVARPQNVAISASL